MTTGVVTRERRVVGVGWAALAVVVGACVLTYLAYAAYLSLFASEGAVPPRWRVPEVPGGAEVVSETKECASGGCWRQLVVRPEAGQTPQDLAREMALVDSVRMGWTWYDPHSVEVVAETGAGDLVLSVTY